MLEQSFGTMQREIGTSIRELNENSTIMLGLLRTQLQETRQLGFSVEMLKIRMDKLEAKFDGHTVLLNEHTKVLDGHTVLLNEHTKVLDGHTLLLNEHTRILGEHTKVLDGHTLLLNEHTRILGEHTKVLDGHTLLLNEHTRILGEHTRILDGHTTRFDRLEDMLTQVLARLPEKP
ncbi:MAG TPA: hypothetical protein VNG51_06670 [Ktedonobacteraceae bacterium]|nr:hypothetical protein [Ktedonobacteraceae bacterium]